MPTKACLLIEAQVGKAPAFVRALQDLDVVQSADRVSGPYDIIAIGDLVTAQEHTIPGITHSVICLRNR